MGQQVGQESQASRIGPRPGSFASGHIGSFVLPVREGHGPVQSRSSRMRPWSRAVPLRISLHTQLEKEQEALSSAAFQFTVMMRLLYARVVRLQRKYDTGKPGPTQISTPGRVPDHLIPAGDRRQPAHAFFGPTRVPGTR
eukprot:2255523-Rhodomonas_salina.1